jgi:hypothetical protein
LAVVAVRQEEKMDMMVDQVVEAERMELSVGTEVKAPMAAAVSMVLEIIMTLLVAVGDILNKVKKLGAT